MMMKILIFDQNQTGFNEFLELRFRLRIHPIHKFPMVVKVLALGRFELDFVEHQRDHQERIIYRSILLTDASTRSMVSSTRSPCWVEFWLDILYES